MIEEEIKQNLLQVCKVKGWDSDINILAFHVLCDKLKQLSAAEEREKFCAVLRQLHDSYSLASDSNDIRARGYANDTSSERVDINGERKHDAQHN
jgi:hypothetical protein